MKKFLSIFLKRSSLEEVKPDFGIFDVVGKPIAVRSSSLCWKIPTINLRRYLFCHMIPSLDDKQTRCPLTVRCYKLFMPRFFYADSKAYKDSYVKCYRSRKRWRLYCRKWYAIQRSLLSVVAGVGRSINYYPINDEKAEEMELSIWPLG